VLDQVYVYVHDAGVEGGSHGRAAEPFVPEGGGGEGLGLGWPRDEVLRRWSIDRVEVAVDVGCA
jgi:hypothetical protein